MGLINTTTLELEEFFGDKIPTYAILSHTWGEEEVSFEDWANPGLACSKKGYKKIIETCRLAKTQKYQYVWVDTNCINKSSSSELTEAINSMFQWYEMAMVCYVYLAEVEPQRDGMEGLHDKLSNSRWFTRGWTLQELLAPHSLEFYSRDWKFLGTKCSLCASISAITNVNAKYIWRKSLGNSYIANPAYMRSFMPNLSLPAQSRDRLEWDERYIAQTITYAVPLKESSIAERFSWVSGRTTTRVEDMAYCMLGIFDISMPLLYGEGSKAFTRLQEEIMKASNDHFLFCWSLHDPNRPAGFISLSADEFCHAGQLIQKRDRRRPSPYSLTNDGLSITLPIFRSWYFYVAILDVESSAGHRYFGVAIDGDLEYGRLYRRSFPPGPIPLYGLEHKTETFNLFISDTYGLEHAHDRNQVEELGEPLHGDFSKYCQSAVFLTFDVPSTEFNISTYPPRRFNENLGCLELFQYHALTTTGHPALFVDLAPKGSRSEGVLVRVES